MTDDDANDKTTLFSSSFSWTEPGQRAGQTKLEHFFMSSSTRKREYNELDNEDKEEQEQEQEVEEKEEEEPELDDDQKAIVEQVLSTRRKNIFVTGSAGSGKSFVLRAIVKALRNRGRRVAVVSSTGRSAVELDLGATTLHHFLALGDTGTKSVATYVKRLLSWEALKEHTLVIRSLDTLIIDEVSMLSGQFLEKASAILSAVRRSTVAWGGLQIVFSGDFAQLRPVYNRYQNGDDVPTLAFKANVAWGTTTEMRQLTKQHRQSQDTEYAELLNRARFGRLTPTDIAALQQRRTTVAEADARWPDALRLYSTNARADDYNQRKMEKLDPESERVFIASIVAGPSQTTRTTVAARPRTSATRKQQLMDEAAGNGRKWMRENMRALPTLKLRLGARVLLLCNLDVANGLANGSMGTIVGFDGMFPRVQFDRDPAIQRVITPHMWIFDSHPKWQGTYSQVPLMLGFAATIHRSQGLTIDRVVADISAATIHDAGMAYVVLTRVRSLNTLHLIGFSSAAVYADAEVCQFYGVDE